jgi:hypothetical protein
MLNINLESSETQAVKGHGQGHESNQQTFGRQLSVQELFDGKYS